MSETPIETAEGPKRYVVCAGCGYEGIWPLVKEKPVALPLKFGKKPHVD